MTYHHVAACKCASQGIHEDCLVNTARRDGLLEKEIRNMKAAISGFLQGSEK